MWRREAADLRFGESEKAGLSEGRAVLLGGVVLERDVAVASKKTPMVASGFIGGDGTAGGAVGVVSTTASVVQAHCAPNVSWESQSESARSALPST